ncbi:RDD family protein [Floccifex sp.]|uniref:RDD family protein n=1 Tax=Floccifex sp. TaxID=2815810 RepID=UPI003F104CE7
MNLFFKLKLCLNDSKSDVSTSKRFTAYLIDWFVGALFMMFPMCLIWMSQTHNLEEMGHLNLWMIQSEISKESAVLAGCLAICFSVFYYVWIPYKVYKGQTLGKKMMNFKIVKTNNEEIDLKTLMIRQILGIMILEGTFYNVSSLWHDLLSLVMNLNFTGILMIIGLSISIISAAICMFSNSHRMIHDRIAHTKVILIKGE